LQEVSAGFVETTRKQDGVVIAEVEAERHVAEAIFQSIDDFSDRAGTAQRGE